MEVATAGRPTDFYHGTSNEAILSIQQSGFRVDLCGTNAGAALGHGVYVTTTLEKALNYAKGPSNNPNPARGGVLVLEVDLGRCYTVRSSSVSERTDWQQRGYHSAWAAEGVIGDREENCVRDPGRIRITNVVLPHTGEARRLGYEIRSGRLERAGAVQMRSGPAHMFTRAQLKAAVEKGDVAAVWSWIDGGGQIDLPFEIGPYSGISMLEMSAAHGHERMVDLLLRRGANVNLFGRPGQHCTDVGCQQQ